MAGNQLVVLYVVSDTGYELFLKQNAAEKTLSGQDLSDDTSLDQLCQLQVNAPAGTKVEVRISGTSNLVTNGTVAGNQWLTLYVVKGTYDLYLEQNAETKSVAIDCTGESASSDQLSKVEVNAPANTQVTIRKGGSAVTGGTVAGNQWVTLYVVSDTGYELFLKQNAAEKTLSSQDLSADSKIYELCTLKVNAPASTAIQVLTQGTSGLVTSGTVAGNQWLTLYVVRGTYDVTDGTSTKAVTCTGATASVAFP